MNNDTSSAPRFAIGWPWAVPVQVADAARTALTSVWSPLITGGAFWTAFMWRSRMTIGGTTYFSLLDDAMISMSHARTLAHGGGMVWYPGAPRVEGITNPLWTMMMAALHLLPVPERLVSLGVMLVGVSILVGIVLLVRSLVGLIVPHRPMATTIGGWLAASFYPLAFWTLRGMEVGLLALLVTVLLVSATRIHLDVDRRRFGLVFALTAAIGVLVRVDFAVMAVAVSAAIFAAGRREAERTMTRCAVLGGVSVALTLGVSTVLRYAYYGELAPNTYTLKVTGWALTDRLTRGAGMVGQSMVGHLGLLVVAAVWGWFVLRGSRRGFPATLFLLVIAAAFAYDLYVGGDAWENWNYDAFTLTNRYLTTVAPALIVLAAIGVDALAHRLFADTKVRVATSTVGAVAALVGAAVYLFFRWRSVDSLHRVGEVVAAAGVGVFAIGMTGLRFRKFVAPPGLAAALLTCGLIVGINGGSWDLWRRFGAQEQSTDREWTAVGLAIARSTHPNTTIAIFGAGALQYFSHRPAVDLLGKMDAHIASLPLNGNRIDVPGHMKWDVRYSICELQPDLVVQLFRPTDQDLKALVDCGYTKFDTTRMGTGISRFNGQEMWLRNGATDVDVARLCALVSGLALDGGHTCDT